MAAASTSAVACAASPRAFHGAWRAWARSKATGDKSAMVGRYGERLRRASQRRSLRPVREEARHDPIELRRLFVVRQHAGWIENRELERRVERHEAASVLDWGLDSLFSPHEHDRLTETSDGAANIQVEMTREERRRRVARAGLMRGTIVDVDQLRRHEIEIDVRALEPIANAASRRQRVEHRGTDERCVDHESRHIAAGRRGAVAPYEPRRLDEDQRWVLPRIARAQHGSVGRRQ